MSAATWASWLDRLENARAQESMIAAKVRAGNVAAIGTSVFALQQSTSRLKRDFEQLQRTTTISVYVSTRGCMALETSRMACRRLMDLSHCFCHACCCYHISHRTKPELERRERLLRQLDLDLVRHALCMLMIGARLRADVLTLLSVCDVTGVCRKLTWTHTTSATTLQRGTIEQTCSYHFAMKTHCSSGILVCCTHAQPSSARPSAELAHDAEPDHERCERVSLSDDGSSAPGAVCLTDVLRLNVQTKTSSLTSLAAASRT